MFLIKTQGTSKGFVPPLFFISQEFNLAPFFVQQLCELDLSHPHYVHPALVHLVSHPLAGKNFLTFLPPKLS